MDSDLIVDMYIDEKKIEKDYEEFLEILREETLNLKYEELHSKEYDKENNPHNLRIEWKYEYVDVNTGEKTEHIRSEYFEINNKCVKSIEWINSNMK